MATILVTGVTGQIGWYLAEQLLAEGHVVLGARRPGQPATGLPPGVLPARGTVRREDVGTLVNDNGDLTAIVHLAGKSTLTDSWDTPMDTFDANGALSAALAFAAAARKTMRFVHASSAEIFGVPPGPVQNEATPIAPVSPYGVAKAAAHMAVQVGRERYGAPMSNLILFASESVRRSPHFVFRKITRGIAAIARGEQETLTLGSTSAVRDFSHARDQFS